MWVTDSQHGVVDGALAPDAGHCSLRDCKGRGVVAGRVTPFSSGKVLLESLWRHSVTIWSEQGETGKLSSGFSSYEVAGNFDHLEGDPGRSQSGVWKRLVVEPVRRPSQALPGEVWVCEQGCVGWSPCLEWPLPPAGRNHGYFIIAVLKGTLGTEIFQCVL